MPTDLVALAARKRHERPRAANEMSAMLASLGVCLVNLILIFALPTLANAVAVFGSVLIESRIYHFRPAWLVASRSSR